MKEKFLNCAKTARDRLNCCGWFSTLVMRVVLGIVFIGAGYSKFADIEQTTFNFQSLDIFWPCLFAWLVAFFELFGGLAVLLGIAARIFSVPLFVIMFVALTVAHGDEIGGMGDLFQATTFLYMIFFLYLLCRGAGRASIDWYINKKYF